MLALVSFLRQKAIPQAVTFKAGISTLLLSFLPGERPLSGMSLSANQVILFSIALRHVDIAGSCQFSGRGETETNLASSHQPWKVNKLDIWCSLLFLSLETSQELGFSSQTCGAVLRERLCGEDTVNFLPSFNQLDLCSPGMQELLNQFELLTYVIDLSPKELFHALVLNQCFQGRMGKMRPAVLTVAALTLEWRVCLNILKYLHSYLTLYLYLAM